MTTVAGQFSLKPLGNRERCEEESPRGHQSPMSFLIVGSIASAHMR